MVGNREHLGWSGIRLLTSVTFIGACNSVLGIGELYEGPRDAEGASSGNSSSAGSSSSGGNASAGSNGSPGGNASAGSNGSPGGNAAAGSALTGGTAGSSGDGGTGGMPEVAGPVKGKVVDFWGHALPNVLIQVADQTGTTDAKGEFAFEDVPAEYDASLYIKIPSPTSNFGWVYQGVTRRDPTFQVYDAREDRETPVLVNSVNGPYPLAATDTVGYSIALADGVFSGKLGTMVGVEVRPGWFGATTTMGTAHALAWSFDAATRAPTQYSAYASKPITLKEGTMGDTITFDLAPQATLASAALGGTITAVGDGARVNQLFARFDSHATIELMTQKDAANTFSYLVPALPEASIMFAASEGNPSDGPFSVVHADGLKGGDSGVELTIPLPATLLQPAGGGAEGVAKSQVFKLLPGAGNDGPFLVHFERGDRAYYALFVVTAKTELTIPEVVGGAFDLDQDLGPNSYYEWTVMTHGDHDNVDDMLGPDGFLDAFGYLSGIPAGPHHKSGSYTRSATGTFTTAP